ncbi:outer membrane beta-barrel protein [Geothrix oryzisoli]|uniref:outer membrane beta-barrel protein n=1 Tax=Geothrix oryzisoli TaxID=2922721 RepID=UPI001FADFC8B|nr:outer membrane beta-barrel protein [Geothrix oryzisoli]
MSVIRSHGSSLFILLCSLSLGAQEAFPSSARLYVGFTVGSQHTEVARTGQAGLTPLDRGTLGLLTGATFGPTWGAELGFHFLGRYPAGSSTDAYGTIDWEREVHGLSFTGTARVQLGRRVALYGQAGLMFWSAEPRSHQNGWASVTDGRDRGRSGGTPLLATGLDFSLGQSWDLRLEASVADRILEARMTRCAAGFIYRF